MRANRSLVITLSALLLPIVGCRKHITIPHVVTPVASAEDYVVAGDVVTWHRQTDQISKVVLRFAYGLCADSPQGVKDPATQTVTFTANGDETITCKVLPQAYPVPQEYDYDTWTTVSPQTKSVAPQTKPYKIPFNVKSCRGCSYVTVLTEGSSLTKGTQSAKGTAMIHATTGDSEFIQLKCEDNTSQAPSNGVVSWRQQAPSAGWTITFPSDNTPCSGDYTFTGATACVLSGTPGTTYNYKIDLPNCNPTSYAGALTLTAPTAPASSVPPSE